MRKWCPEPFKSGTFISPMNPDQAVDNPRFEKDPGLTGRDSTWDLMNQSEKDLLLDRARELLIAEFDTRENELLLRHQVELSDT